MLRSIQLRWEPVTPLHPEDPSNRRLKGKKNSRAIRALLPFTSKGEYFTESVG